MALKVNRRDAREPPKYFERVRAEAKGDWDDLEKNPRLRAPWDQLFAQVKSPRHVISELLQNAEDAGADRVEVTLEDGTLRFAHTGDDFTADQFGSLCRFGFSNKRHLHTIGFRGIGFKSIFSLGREVRLFTPTLAVSFHERRFTEPKWLGEGFTEGETIIEIDVEDADREEILRRSLEEWTKSPVSLLFFQNIRELTFEGTTITIDTAGEGPVPGSEWMEISGAHKGTYLVIRSEPEPFPAACVEEIRRERMDESFEAPPASVSIVLIDGNDSRLHVVLPTAVKPGLPFHINGPFIQDPARIEIKSPGQSATNRWLLTRVAKLASEALIAWVNDQELSEEDRAEAYALAPDIIHPEGISFDVREAVVRLFRTMTQDANVVLDHEGNTRKIGDCARVPSDLQGIWPPRVFLDSFATGASALLHPRVPPPFASKLVTISWVREVNAQIVLDGLTRHPGPPLPRTPDGLKILWSYAEARVRDWRSPEWRLSARNLAIVPVRGDDRLDAAANVVRLPPMELHDPTDASFITRCVRIIDPAWIAASTSGTNAYPTVYLEAQLDKATALDQVLNSVARAVEKDEDIVRCAHLAAHWDVAVTEEFRYITENGLRLMAKDGVVHDPSGNLAELVPLTYKESHWLAPEYAAPTSATRERWASWAKSPKSRLLQRLPLHRTTKQVWRRSEVESFARERFARRSLRYNYKRDHFIIEDYDFDDALVQSIEARKDDREARWALIVDALLTAPGDVPANARIWQKGNTERRQVTEEPLPAAWVIRVRSIACLRDDRGRLSVPASLLLRTPATEPLKGLQPFVDPTLDTPDNRDVLRAFGARQDAADPELILQQIRILIAKKAPLTELTPWFNALDFALARPTESALAQVRGAFESEAIIPTSDGAFAKAPQVALSDPDASGLAATIEPQIRGLGMWTKLGVPERPSLEHALVWLEKLPKNKALSKDEARRIMRLLERHGEHILGRTNAWLDIDGAWRNVSDFRYLGARLVGVSTEDIFPAVRAQTADTGRLRQDELPAALRENRTSLKDAVSLVADLEQATLDESTKPAWISSLASCFARVKTRQDERIREYGRLLDRIEWVTYEGILLIQAHIAHQPVTPPLRRRVLWDKDRLYVPRGKVAPYFRELVETLFAGAPSEAAKEAVTACSARDDDWILAYMTDHFELAEPGEQVEATPVEAEKTLVVQSTTAAPPTKEPAKAILATEAKHAGPLREDERRQLRVARSHAKRTHKKPPTPRTALAPQQPALPSEPTADMDDELFTIFATYAAGQGFTWQATRDRFEHPTGVTIVESDGEFDWKEIAPGGAITRRFRTLSGRLETGVAMPAPLWKLLQRLGRDVELILAAGDGAVAYTGEALAQALAANEIEVQPDRYLVKSRR
jgi:hypothetical protein